MDIKTLEQLNIKNEKSKIHFIHNLLRSQLLDSNHKEKLIKYASDELGKLEADQNGVKNDVEIIKKKLSEISNSIGSTITNKELSHSSQTFHKPQELVNLMSRFRMNGSALKYSVHNWDVGLEYMDYKSFTEQLIIEYKEINSILNELSKPLAAKCYAFLQNKDIGKSGWGYDRIKVGWSSHELANWCYKNPKKNPFEYPFKFSDPDKNIHFSTFRDVIHHFKSEIEVRAEENQLKKIILNELKKAGLLTQSSLFNRPILKNLESKTFYTDVQWFRSAIALIFRETKKKRKLTEECNDISIEALEDNESISLVIKHINSFSEGYSIETNNKLTAIGGDFGSLKEKLFNLCDWSIETKFKEGCFRLNYLCSNININFIEPIDHCDGFSHVLKFYKSSM
jgi:hypothetical protein